VTDYFALLAQPRRPWLDLDTLEEKYCDLARTAHPDQSTQPSNDFVELNQAYRTLRDPKSRLQHLLTLEGYPPSAATAEIPADLSNLFMKIAPAIAKRDKEEIDALNKKLSDHYEEALGRLHRLDDTWDDSAAVRMNDAENLYRRFAFVTRWKDLIEQRQFETAHDG
jgi:curved DNA-binding protein CbpA